MTTNVNTIVERGIVITGDIKPEFQRILTPEALDFVEVLARDFTPRVDELLSKRLARQRNLDAGKFPDFLPETTAIRSSNWKVAPIPESLLDRRVEITGPVDRKIIINALNSGASTFMADFEDSSSPTWDNMLQGQVNLHDAVNRTIEFTSDDGKNYSLNEQTAVLQVRPRGWHLQESHALVDGNPVPASLWDFGLFFYHNASALMEKGCGPYFYLPKMQSHLEARLWNDVFNYAQDKLNIPRGTIKATVLIEHILAAFEMDEILYELREHSAGLNCGRWDYIFSFIKCFRNHPEYVMPDRSRITMETHFMSSYSILVIKTCHRRGVHAIGGMAAQIPIKEDILANEKAMAKIRDDKEREANNGHDGSWVSHPAMVPICKDIFDSIMPAKNQIGRQRDDVEISTEDLLKVPEGPITIQGMENNINVAVQYIEAWLGGTGSVPIHDLMEDAATAEIARAQIWQWITHPAGVLADGRRITGALFRDLLEHELESVRLRFGDVYFNAHKYKQAAMILDSMVTCEELPEFLTIHAGAYLS